MLHINQTINNYKITTLWKIQRKHFRRVCSNGIQEMLIVLAILLCINEFECISFDVKNPIGCNIEDKNFWKIYRWHFGNATSITIISLENSHVYNTREFLTEFLHHLYLHRLLTKTFIIKKHTLTEEENDNKYLNIKYEDCECKSKINATKTDLFQTVLIYQNFIRFQRMKRYVRT